MKLLTCLIAVYLFTSNIRSYAAEIWVATNGNDANAGTRDHPKLTIEGALRQARELRRLNDATIAGGIHIIIRTGKYVLYEPLFIRLEDSGTAMSPTIIESAPQAKPIVSGGVAVINWKRILNTIPGLPPVAQGKV